MAKQSFTTGQVLLASQLTSLQQTALGGGAASAKVASYTLVAADAGTAISMTNASATTITVNTGLFSAGDTVLIQNLGAGVCTVTAGTATVNTAGSLALAQYEAGVLYFVSPSAAVLFDYTQTAGSGGTGGYTLLNSGGTALSGSATVTVSGITSNDLLIFITGAASSSTGVGLNLKFNSSSTNHYANGFRIIGNSSYAASNFDQVNVNNAGVFNLAFSSTSASRPMYAYCLVQACTSTTIKPVWYSGGCDGGAGTGQQSISAGGYFDAVAAITSVSAVCQNGTFNAGTLFVYGRS